MDASNQNGWECTRCGAQQVIVFPFHGVDNGGPLVCPSCAIYIEDSYRQERDSLLSWYGLGSNVSRSPAGDTELSLELLTDVLALTHPDMHPPERAKRAHRVTAALTALKPYLRPARKPVTPKPSPDGGKQASRRKLPTFPCVRCMVYPPMYYCKACRTEWDKRQEKECEGRRAKQREQYARRRRTKLYRAPPTTCPSCGTEFKPKRADTKYCTPACRQRAHRARNGSVNVHRRTLKEASRGECAGAIAS